MLRKIIKTQEKKAILLPEVMKIIIAVCCILLLLYLAYKIYGLATLNNQLSKARTQINIIGGKIQSLQESSSTSDISSTNYLMFNPLGWVLTGWPYASGKDTLSVPFCVAKKWNKCLCLCPSSLTDTSPRDLVKECSINNICIEVKADILEVNSKDASWRNFEGLLKPIDIKKVNKDFEGNLVIGYNNMTKNLTIIPQKATGS